MSASAGHPAGERRQQVRDQTGQHAALLIAVAMMALGWLSPGAAAQEVNPERTRAVKAGMVINFIRYTTWPDAVFTDGPSKSPIVLTVVGDLDMHLALTSAAAGQTFQGRTLEVRYAPFPEPQPGERHIRPEDLAAHYDRLRASHAVFFGSSERDRFRDGLRQLAGRPVLTIGDVTGFAERGGMLGFEIRNRKVAFDANEDSVRESELRISSQVLRLAKRVPSRDAGGGG